MPLRFERAFRHLEVAVGGDYDGAMKSNDQPVLPFEPEPETGSREDSDTEDGGGTLPSDRVVEDYREAAERGDAKAQFLLAQMYHYGCSGVARDLVQAFVWYAAAIVRGYPHSGGI